MRWGWLLGALFGLVALVGGPVSVLAVTGAPANAGTSCAGSNTTVTSNADTATTGTLRTAITNANTNTGAQTICIDTTQVTSPIVLVSALPTYTNSAALTIQGNGATLDGNGNQAIHSTSSGLLTINGLTITGASAAEGGAIEGGPVTLTNSTISGNTATSEGGGVESFGTAVTLTNSTISNNHAPDEGGIDGGAVTLTDSTVSGNIAASFYGGFDAGEGATLTNSTVSGNTAGSEAGGFNSDGPTILTNSTVSGNTAADGGGIYANDSPLTLVYATVAANSAPTGANVDLAGATLTSFASVVALAQGGTNCANLGAITSHGFNLEDDAAASCGFSTATEDVAPGTAADLGPLANNGGPTQTMLPQDGPSPLIDGVPAASCQADGAAGITTDQRGLPRPDTASPNCDIGAVEVQPAAPTPTALLITPTFTG